MDKIQRIIDDARYGVSLNEDIDASTNQTTLAPETSDDGNFISKNQKLLNETNDERNTNQTSVSSYTRMQFLLFQNV